MKLRGGDILELAEGHSGSEMFGLNKERVFSTSSLLEQREGFLYIQSVGTKRGFSLQPVCWNKERVFSTTSLLEQREGFLYNQSVGTKRGFSLQPVCWNDTTNKKTLEEMFSNLFLFNAGFGYRKSGPMQRLCRTSVQLVPGAESGCSKYSWTVQTYQVNGFLL